MRALILAAGMGSRLCRYTGGNTKCLVSVGGKTLLERTAHALKQAGIDRLTMVLGYRGEAVKAYVREHIRDIRVDFIDNPDYATSNNIWSLYLARDILLADDTILIESDLIFDPSLPRLLAEDPRPDLAVVASYRHWMDGTVTLLDETGRITEFLGKADFDYGMLDRYYKTVNVYKFSRSFSRDIYLPALEEHMRTHGLNEYYEAALKGIAESGRSDLCAFDIAGLPWYEVDDGQDLAIAEALFADSAEEMYRRISLGEGGNWRYNGVSDLSVPGCRTFPPKAMTDKMGSYFRDAAILPPSGQNTLQLLCERVFDVDKAYFAAAADRQTLVRAAEDLGMKYRDCTWDLFDGEKFPMDEDRIVHSDGTLLLMDLGTLYGVPGLPMWAAASRNTEQMTLLREKLRDARISAPAEYFLQIFPLFRKQWKAAVTEALRAAGELRGAMEQSGLFETVEFRDGMLLGITADEASARELALSLLWKYRIYVKTAGRALCAAPGTPEETARLIAVLQS